MNDAGTTVKVEAGFPIYSKFLDRWFTAETRIREGETRADAIIRLEKELNETADRLRKEVSPHLYEEQYPNKYDGRDRFEHLTSGQLPPIQVEYGPPPVINLESERIQIAIENAANLDELKAVKSLYPAMTVKLMASYNSKIQELGNGPSDSFADGLD
jgi:hypothetical protein